ncbi:hypothetical protein BT1A1_3258 [Caldibacillus thermoamylovorans]|uniref:Uncharacterized protein n=1 Tax=Caldibacillus thermoamylovorans TaxID=35841 RepID=A0A090J548_9BACI|nr:glycosyltransferase family 39 protein [Caldibacillus thermoamylovorans]CEE03040.1 hypothetical protein BT1A1_3258 [Caldibacillus thermoamylovorans]
MESKLNQFLVKTIFIIFSGISIFLVILNMFNYAGFEPVNQYPPKGFITITLLMSIVFIYLFYRYRSLILNIISKFDKTYLVLSLLLISIIIQLIIIILFSTSPYTWDFGNIIIEAETLLSTGHLGRYSTLFPNNWLLILIIYAIGKILFPSLMLYEFFNVAIITVSQFFIYRIATKLLGRKVGIFSLLLSIFFFPYMFYSPIVYSDTISLIFLVLPLNILINRDGNMKKEWLPIVSASILFAFGYLIKGSLIVFSIALSVVLLLFLKKWKRVFFLIPLVIVFLINSGFHFTVFQSGIIDKEVVEKNSYPFTHWIMMGQNRTNFGKWTYEDVDLTEDLLSKHPKDEVKKYHLKEIEARFKERGVLGSINYNIKKIRHTWADGTYFSLNKLMRTPFNPDNFTRLTTGFKHLVVQGYARIQHLFILIGLVIFSIKTFKDRNEFYTFGMLSVIGFFLFFILWEARSRYIVSVTPILILLSCIGYFNNSKDKSGYDESNI